MGKSKLVDSLKQFADKQFQEFNRLYGQQVLEVLEFPIKVVLSPFTLAYDIAGSAPRGFGVPEFISGLSFSTIFVVATLGTYDITCELGKRCYVKGIVGPAMGGRPCSVLCAKAREGAVSGETVHLEKDCLFRAGPDNLVNTFRKDNYGEKATAECIADAIADNRAEIVHLPSSMNFGVPLPSKDCPDCDGSGVMKCPECKGKLQIRISADNIMEPPWKAYDIMRKMDYPYEHIVHSMKDPGIAAFWLITMPQIMGGFNYDDDVKQKIWWQYKESMRYDELRDVVATRKPGWEYLQEALKSIDPARAKDDPIIVRNVPYYRAKKALEAEVMKLDAPPRPQNWGELSLPLDESSWTEEDHKDPTKLDEMRVLLNAQREIADKMLDAQWEAKWRQEQLNKMLIEKVQPYIQNIDNNVLPGPILQPQTSSEKKRKNRQRRWWLF